MNLDNLVKRGRRPWLPSPHASQLDVWHEYEVPTAGTFESNGCLILFTLVGELDPDRQVSVWAYTQVAAEQTHGIQFKSAADMDTWIYEQFIGANVVFALAKDQSIDRWAPEDRISSLLDGANRFMDAVLAELRPKPVASPALEFEVLQAEVGVLVDREASAPA